ncbi:MAG TPA: glycosyltransferase family 4 protein [Phycisphaerae bacterium]|nr:glycosyltransferase family 4 protein [Phycisphaerae bacterium]
MNKRILWIINGGEVYGERRAIVSLMSGVRAAGWEAEAVSLLEGGCTEELRAAGLPVSCMGLGDSPGMHLARSRVGRGWQLLRLLGHQGTIRRAVAKEIARRQPMAVHVLDKNILPGVARAARELVVPCFWEMTAVVGSGYAWDLNRRLHGRLIRRGRLHTLANSRYTAESLGEVGRPVQVMYLGVDEERFDPARVVAVDRGSMGIPADAPVFVIVARVDPTKGQGMFLEALQRAGRGDEHLMLVGAETGSLEVDRLAARALALGMGHRVHCVPRTGEPERYLAMADVAVNARIDAEPFGLSVVEAMMMGKPVLVHALGGPAETVEDRISGWHIAAATLADFAEGIQRALADHEKWACMGAAARQRALKQFSLAAQAKWYLDYVQQTCGVSECGDG